MKIITMLFACLMLAGAQEQTCFADFGTTSARVVPCPKASITDLQTVIRALEAKVAALEKQVEAIKEFTDALQGKRPVLWAPPSTVSPTFIIGDGDVDYGRWLREHPETNSGRALRALPLK